MLRNIFILFIIGTLCSCNLNRTKSTGNIPTTETEPKFDIEKIAQMRLTSADGYRKVLNNLDQSDLNSIGAAVALFKNCETDTISRDSMFVAFNWFFNNVAGGYLQNNEDVNLQLENPTSKDSIDKIKTMFASYGINLASSEGTYYLEPQKSYLLTNFGPGLSQAYSDYLAIEAKEEKERFAEDGTILIPTDSLISRIIAYENFMGRYPGFISLKIAQDQYAQYLGAYLAGIDNSRIFDVATNRLNDGQKKSFEGFIIKYPGRKSAEVVKAYLDLLQNTNFIYTDKVDSFLLEWVYME